MKGKALVISFFLCLCICLTSNASILYVGKNGYKTIQQAIDAAMPRDTIIVYSGIYYENIVINKSITIIGEDANNTIIYNQLLLNIYQGVVTINADGVNISGFTIKSKWDSVKGIFVTSNNNKIVDNIITKTYTGMLFRNSSNNIIMDNIIKNCKTSGIRFDWNKTKNNIISNNIIENNTESGIIMRMAENSIISNNSIYNNKKRDDFNIFIK